MTSARIARFRLSFRVAAASGRGVSLLPLASVAGLRLALTAQGTVVFDGMPVRAFEPRARAYWLGFGAIAITSSLSSSRVPDDLVVGFDGVITAVGLCAGQKRLPACVEHTRPPGWA